MSSTGRVCVWCQKPIAVADRVALCDRCVAAHHEECWDRNGRCSTFRCSGLPRTMRGDEVRTAQQLALEQANREPTVCPFCTNAVYVGSIRSARPPSGVQQQGSGLIVRSHFQPDAKTGSLVKRLLGRAAPARTWFLAGGHVRSRSCGSCKRLFLWGLSSDDALALAADREEAERFCPRCSGLLWPAEILCGKKHSGGAYFECDETPNLHRDWFGHHILDRYVYNRWPPPIPSLAAHICPECLYTEVAGRPIYRFL